MFALALLYGMLGASLASFLGVIASRTQRGETIDGRSHCACGRDLKWYENIPILGWLRIKGTANCCGVKIPALMFVTELLSFSVFFMIGIITLLSINNVSTVDILSVIGSSALFLLGTYFSLRNDFRRRNKYNEIIKQ